jgi:BirA family biotin operon repressor/biotin-[acetyl-CoA-carboxylase] ligase
LGITEVGLKWPNDLLWDWRKLGGILLEFGGESSGPCHVVAGVGVNVAMPDSAREAIDQPWIDLRSILGPNEISRNRLAARVVSEMLKTCARFEQQGFEPPPEWKQLDVTLGQRITLQLPNNTRIDGISRGIDNSGALLLETATGIQRFLGGEVSLRLAE